MSRLAIDGGIPVRTSSLPYGRQVVDDDDVRAVVEALRADWLTTGPTVEAFERAFAERVGARYAVAVASGTAALHAAAFAAGIHAGDEAVVPPLTFAATANCVRYQSGTVVFADVCPGTLLLDPACVETALSNRTKAILTVDYAGQPSHINELLVIAERRGLVLIEDASHSLGASYQGRSVGSRAHLTTFSLHPVKIITTGEGGVVTTDDAALADRMRKFRNHGISATHRERAERGSWLYDIEELGFNYRLTDLQCALGISQLKKLDGWVRRRNEIAARYTAAFADLSALRTLAIEADRSSSWHLFVLLLELDRLTVSRDLVFAALRAENLGVNVHYMPVPWHSYYRNLGYRPGGWPVCEDAYRRMVTIPLFAGMTDRDVEDVTEAVRKVVSHYTR